MSLVVTEETSAPFASLQPLWHRSAPESVKNCTSTDPLDCWTEWQAYLTDRKRPKSPKFLSGKKPPLLWGCWTEWQAYLTDRKRPKSPKFLSGKKPPLLWGWPDSWQGDSVRAMLRSPSSRLQPALEEAKAGRIDLPLALELVAFAMRFAATSGQLAKNAWWQAVELLQEIASESQQQHVDWPGDAREVVPQQLLAGELPLALGYSFPEIRALRLLNKSARSALSEALVELTDGQGLPHARLLPVLGPLFACWTRCRWLGDRLNRGPWSREAELQYQWLVRDAIRLADADGRFVLTWHEDQTPAWTKPLFRTALELAGDCADCAAAAAAISRDVVPKGDRSRARDLPNPSVNSDWSGIAVMANGWSQSDNRLAVGYSDIRLQFDLSVRGERLFAGVWEFQTTCDGEQVKVVGEWERLCCESGKRCDFLELGIELSHGVKLERQLLFARKDRVLYLADIVKSTDGTAHHIEHSFGLPLEMSVAWQPEIETRDGVLLGEKARVAVLPLALKEWRADPRGGKLRDENGRLTLTQETNSRALCCPLLLDLDRKRSKCERTWRQLTIGEWLEIVPQDMAVGYRAQSGDDQWLFYRSVGPVGNRTFLGQNIAGEFSAGRFRDNKYKEWLEIEAV